MKLIFTSCIAFSLVSRVAVVAVAQTADTDPLVLDLSSVQNEKFVTEGKTNALWQSVAGRQVFDGLTFQIDGRGCVYGKKMGAEKRSGTNTFPDHIGIQVGRKFEELHLVHVTQYADVEGQEIARIRLNYADGSEHEFPIQFGGHVRDWHRMPSEEKELLTDANTKIVWRGPGVERIKSTLRLFKTVLANPQPDKTVATIDVLSSKHLAAYDLIAATVANRDAKRPPTPPPPAEEPDRKFDGVLTVRVVERGSAQPVAGALVDPMMHVDDVSAIVVPVLTATNGEAVIRYPVERADRISVTVEADDYGMQRASVQLESRPTNLLEMELISPPKLSGIAKDGTGARLSSVAISLWPPWRAESKGAKTDSDGRFKLTWNPQNQSVPDYELFIIAQDFRKSLATAQPVDEEATNLVLRLEPALTIAGRATGPESKVLTNVEAELMFRSERIRAGLGKATRADSTGQFEIKALPAGRRYSVIVSAMGYGRVTRNVEPEVENRRVELEPCELPLADRRLAGIVVDADDKPITNAYVYGYGEGQPNMNGRTDSKGRFSFAAVCPGPITLHANSPGGGFGTAAVEGGDTNVTLQIGVRESYETSRSARKLSGVVTDPDGHPAVGVAVSTFPSFSSSEKKTGPDGCFSLTFDPQQFGGSGEVQQVVIARDMARGLAAAIDLEESATNANLRLGPALTLAGQITGPNGKTIPVAQATLWFHTENRASMLGRPVKADSQGRFEVKALPQGRQYSINASARGFGQQRRNVPATETATNRIELEVLQLATADQKIAGVVLDDDDQPVTRASIYSYGEGQPNLNATTDSKGHFTLEKICAGAIRLSVNTRSGGYASATAEAGDTNCVIRVGASRFVRTSESQVGRLKGKPLPDPAPLGLAPADVAAGQPVLALLIDAEQRPSRRALRLLGEQAPALKAKGVAVVAIQAGGMAEDAFKAWKQEAALPFPVGCIAGNAEKARASWGAGALPWLILTDKSHHVTAEGFAIEDLEAKLSESAK